MVPGAGLEPARCCHRRILSPLRLPISPPGHRANAEVGTLFQIFHSRSLRPAVYHNATRASSKCRGWDPLSNFKVNSLRAKSRWLSESHQRDWNLQRGQLLSPIAKQSSRINMEARPGIEPGYTALQAAA